MYIFLKWHVYGVDQKINHSKYTISLFRSIVGHIKNFQQVNFGNTREFSLIDTECMCYDNRNDLFLKIEMIQQLETHEQSLGNLWYIYSIVEPICFGVILILSGDVVNPISRITLVIFFEVLPSYLFEWFKSIYTDIN